MRLIDADKLKAKYPTDNSLCQKVDDEPTAVVEVWEREYHGAAGDYGFLNSHAEVTILDYIGEDSEITIPCVIMGNLVRFIKGRAFNSRCKLERVVIPDIIRNIEENAFIDCPMLTSVTIPRRFERRIKKIFTKCPNLKEIIYTEA